MPREYPGGFYRCSPPAESDLLRTNVGKISERKDGGKIKRVVEKARAELRGVDVASLTGKKRKGIEGVEKITENKIEVDSGPRVEPRVDVTPRRVVDAGVKKRVEMLAKYDMDHELKYGDIAEMMHNEDVRNIGISKERAIIEEKRPRNYPTREVRKMKSPKGDVVKVEGWKPGKRYGDKYKDERRGKGPDVY